MVVLRLPSLRERSADIPLLVEHFLREAGYTSGVESLIPPATLTSLASHRWPGNVRELRNWVEATLAMGESPELSPESRHDPNVSGDAHLLELPYKDARRLLLDGFEQRYLKHLIEATQGNVAMAARKAQMDRTYLIKLIQRHAIKPR